MANVRIITGDCLAMLPTLPADSVHACVTDPPYHLQTIQKRFANSPRSETTERYAVGAYGRHAKGFMGQKWDGGDIAMRPDVWREVLRVLKPGGHLIASCGTRTEHRVVCAIEDAGFEIRDRVLYLYGSGFPKSLDVSKAIDKATGASDANMTAFVVWATRRFWGWDDAPETFRLAMANHPLAPKETGQ